MKIASIRIRSSFRNPDLRSPREGFGLPTSVIESLANNPVIDPGVVVDFRSFPTTPIAFIRDKEEGKRTPDGRLIKTASGIRNMSRRDEALAVRSFDAARQAISNTIGSGTTLTPNQYRKIVNAYGRNVTDAAMTSFFGTDGKGKPHTVEGSKPPAYVMTPDEKRLYDRGEIRDGNTVRGMTSEERQEIERLLRGS